MFCKLVNTWNWLTPLEVGSLGVSYGKLRKQKGCGPYSMFCKLVNTWNWLTPQEVGTKFS